MADPRDVTPAVASETARDVESGAGLASAGALTADVAAAASVAEPLGPSKEALLSIGELDRSLASGIAWVGSIKWLVQLVNWGVTIVVARLLTPADYGLLGMASVFFVLITLLTESGIGTTIVTVRDLMRRSIEQMHGGAIGLGVAGALVMGAAGFGAAWFFDNRALIAILAVMGASLLVSSARTVPMAMLQRALRFRRIAIIEASQGLLQSAVTLALALIGFRYWSLVIAASAATLFATIATNLSSPVRPRRPVLDELRPVLPFTRHVLVGRLFWFLYQDADFIVAGKRLGEHALGAYSYAWTLASMPVDKITALVGSVTPSVFAAAQHDRAVLARYFMKVVEGLAFLTLPLNLGLALVADDLVLLVLGPKWREMILPLVLLAAYAPVRAVTPPVSQVLMVVGESRRSMRYSGFAAVLLPLSFLIGSNWGTVGIAAAWMIAHPVIFLLHLRLALARLNLRARDYVAALMPVLSGGVVMTLVVLGVKFSLGGANGWVRLAASSLAGALAYGGFMLVRHRDRLRELRTFLRPA